MNALAAGFRALGMVRLLSMAAVALCLMVLLGVLALRGTPEQMALLYAELDTREAGQIADVLERQRVPFQLGAGGTQILVPSGQVARLRVLLARDGLPSGGSIGYEIFDRGDGLTTSQFQQKIAESRALEGELSRTIRAISGVRAARVHLVMPKREPFARERQDAQASVMITTAGNGRLDREAVQSILNLVAGAVPGLRAKNIAVADSKGNLLARAGEPTSAVAAAQGTEEIRRATELRLARAVEEMLERSLGMGRVRAEVAAEMDFERLQETQEKFDPEGQVVRSTQSNTGNTRSSEATPTVSVQNNLPNADAGQAAQAGSQETRAEETTNYEIGKTVRTLVREQPQIRRLSVAVLVDGSEEKGADGTPAWRARTPEELERIARLVRSAVGFDDKRGDKVEVVNMRFAADADAAGNEPRGLFGIVFDKNDVMRLVQILLFGLVGVVALLVVFRPIVNRLTLASSTTLLTGPGGERLEAPGGGVMVIGPDGVPMLEAPGGQAGAAGAAAPGTPRLTGPGDSDDDSMVNLANIEGQLRASSIRRLSDLVSKHPEESLTIVRGWMQQGSF